MIYGGKRNHEYTTTGLKLNIPIQRARVVAEDMSKEMN